MKQLTSKEIGIVAGTQGYCICIKPGYPSTPRKLETLEKCRSLCCETFNTPMFTFYEAEYFCY